MNIEKGTKYKRYEKYTISEDPSIFSGYWNNYEVSLDLLEKLSRDLGFSYKLYSNLFSISKDSAYSLVKSMSLHSNHPSIYLLLDDENMKVLWYSLDSDRSPILNFDFATIVTRLVDTEKSLELSDVYYHQDDTISSVIVKKTSPITIEEKYEGKDSKFIDYEVGILLVNDENNNTYSRLVIYVAGQPLYLPASYYSSTTSRYKKSTSSSSESLEVLLLKVIDDLRGDTLFSKLYEFHYRYRSNKNILVSYEEYNTVLRTMRKIPTIIEDGSYLEKLLQKYEDFEKKYARFEDQKSSYIWRCTAMSDDVTIGALITSTSQILTDVDAPSLEYFAIRELLGAYISTNRIADEIAKESI